MGSATEWIFQTKHIIFGVIVAVAGVHLLGVEKDKTFLNDFLLLSMIFYGFFICLIRRWAQNSVIRFIVATIALFAGTYDVDQEKTPIYWSTISWYYMLVMY